MQPAKRKRDTNLLEIAPSKKRKLTCTKNGFYALPVQMSNFVRFLYFREHKTKDPESAGKILFVTNLTPDCSEVKILPSLDTHFFSWTWKIFSPLVEPLKVSNSIVSEITRPRIQPLPQRNPKCNKEPQLHINNYFWRKNWNVRNNVCRSLDSFLFWLFSSKWLEKPEEVFCQRWFCENNFYRGWCSQEGMRLLVKLVLILLLGDEIETWFNVELCTTRTEIDRITKYAIEFLQSLIRVIRSKSRFWHDFISLQSNFPQQRMDKQETH